MNTNMVEHQLQGSVVLQHVGKQKANDKGIYRCMFKGLCMSLTMQHGFQLDVVSKEFPAMQKLGLTAGISGAGGGAC